MQSHDDRSHQIPPEQLAELTKQLETKAREMTKKKANEITAGAAGEGVLFEAEIDGIYIKRLPEDEHGVQRISIGRAPAIDRSSYLVYRGDPSKILGLLERAVGALRKAIQ